MVFGSYAMDANITYSDSEGWITIGGNEIVPTFKGFVARAVYYRTRTVSIHEVGTFSCIQALLYRFLFVCEQIRADFEDRPCKVSRQVHLVAAQFF